MKRLSNLLGIIAIIIFVVGMLGVGLFVDQISLQYSPKECLLFFGIWVITMMAFGIISMLLQPEEPKHSLFTLNDIRRWREENKKSRS